MPSIVARRARLQGRERTVGRTPLQETLLCVGLGTLGAEAAVDDRPIVEAPPLETAPVRKRRPLKSRMEVVADFRRGEDLLEVAIFARPGIDTVEVDLAASADGRDTCLRANGQILAILRGVPDADFDDFRITVETVGS
jgi:hypothetical protein